MPELSVTEAQRQRLEEVRRDVEEAYVDSYGTTRLEDALQYLLDTYTPPAERERVEAYDRIATAEYPQLQRVASDVPCVPGSGIGADEMRGRLLSELGPVDLAAELDRTDDGDDAAGGADDDGDEPATGGRDPSPAGDEREREQERVHEDGDGGTTTGAETGSESSTPPPRTPTPNRLLGEHDDRWRESDGETPYEVDLPDGTTEPARTKDDVRQLLFRHYS